MTLLIPVLCGLLAVSGLLGLYAWTRARRKPSTPKYVCDLCGETDCTCRFTGDE